MIAFSKPHKNSPGLQPCAENVASWLCMWSVKPTGITGVHVRKVLTSHGRRCF